MVSNNEMKKVQEHFYKIAKDYSKWKKKNTYYYQHLKSFLRRIIRPGSKVLEIGCTTGEMLASVQPRIGVGIDISSELIKIASQKFPQYSFLNTSIEEFRYEGKFDYIIMVDLVDHVYDVMTVFEKVYQFCHPTTKIVLTTINPWWDPILLFMEKLKAKMPEGLHNFIEKRNLIKMIELLDFSINYSGYMLLFPKYIPFLSYLANTMGVRIWGINKFSSVQYMVLQPTIKNTTDLGLGCSVIIPCHNEEGNIDEVVRRIPSMGNKTEVIVVNDGSTDKTADKVRELQKEFLNLKFINYDVNKGKGYAVEQGFNAATQEVLMILDADISVPPEELPRFFNPLNRGLCQFVNGARMVYPMEKQAMRFLNLLGNKIFSLIMTFILKQNVSDTLCGTKALFKLDFQHMKMGLDRWGDFDLLFGTVKLGNKIMEVPVHYKRRKTGESKMQPFRHAFHLLKACIRGLRELVFIPADDPQDNLTK